MPTEHYEATLRAVARIDGAIGMLLDVDHPVPRSSELTSDLTQHLVDAMRACRWFLAAGFDPPEQFGSWLRARLEENDLGPPGDENSDFSASWVWHAADAVDRLRAEWQPSWSM
jgi:hypothetical protein